MYISAAASSNREKTVGTKKGLFKWSWDVIVPYLTLESASPHSASLNVVSCVQCESRENALG